MQALKDTLKDKKTMELEKSINTEGNLIHYTRNKNESAGTLVNTVLCVNIEFRIAEHYIQKRIATRNRK